MTSYSAGSAYLNVLPRLAGFNQRLKRELAGIRVEVDVPVRFDLDRGALAGLGAVLRTLPAIVLDADSSAADRAIAEVRQRMEALSGRTIGLDVSGEAARAELESISGELNGLAAQAPDIGVRVDAAAAEAALEGVQREASRLDGRRVNVRVVADVVGAVTSIAGLALAINGFANRSYSFHVDADTAGAVASIAALAAKVAGLAGLGGIVGGFGGALGGLGAAGAVAGAGLGATIIASLGVGKALTALNGQQDSAAQTAQQSAKQQQSAAYAIASAQDRVKQAAQSANRARVDGARSVADAEKSASRSVEQALKSQATAQRTLRQATTDLKREQATLTQAWEEGRRSLEDLSAQLRGNTIDQQQAAYDLIDAERDLAAAQRTGDPESIDRATIAYDRQRATVDNLRTQGSRLATDNADAQKKGVSGTDQVVAATERIAAATERVSDATVAARDADAEVTRARVDGAEQVARAQEQASQRIADADHSVVEANRALAQALAQTGDAGQAAANKVESAFADLSPAAATFARYLFGLKPLLQELSATAAGEFFPPIQAGLDTLIGRAPIAKTVIGQLAGAMGTGLGDVLTRLASPFWVSFFTLLGDAAGGIIPRLFGSLMTLAEAAATVIRFFLPLAPAAFDLLDQFSALVVVLAPFVAQLLGGLIPAASAFLTALTPLGPVLAALQPILLVLGQAFATVLMAVLQALAPILVALTPLIQALAMQFATTLVAGIQAATPFLVMLADWLSANPSLVIGVITALAGLGVGFKPLLFVLGLAVSALRNFLIIAVVRAALTAFGLEGTIAGKLLLRLLNPLNLIKLVLPLIGRLLAFLGRSLLSALGPVGLLITGLSLLYSSNAEFRDAVNGVLMVLGQLVGQLVTALMPAFQTLLDAILPLVGVFSGALSPVISLVAGLLVDMIKTVLPPLVAILSGVVIPVVAALAQILATVLAWVITNVVVPAFQVVAALLSKVVGPVILWLWQNVVKPAFQAIAALAVWAFTTVIKPIFDALVWFLDNVLGPVFMWLWHNVVEPSFRGIGDFIAWVWNNVIRPTFDGLSRGLQGLSDGFTSTVDWIKRKWAEIQEATRAPVKWVVDVVYNNGLRSVWNGIASLFGMAQLPEIRFARGGIVPGRDAGYDTVPAMLRGGEGVLVPEATRMVGGAAGIEYLNRTAERQGFARGGVVGQPVQHFSLGGIVQGIGGFTSDLFSKGPVEAVKSAFAGATSGAANTPGAGSWRDALVKLPGKMIDAVVEKAKGYIASLASFGGGGGSAANSAQINGWIAQALAILGYPQNYAAGIYQQIMTESGGNPGVTQHGYTDINTLTGNLAQGIMQVIPPTFRANMLPGHGNPFNPVDNIIAGSRYAMRRYGPGWFAPGPRHSHGYDSGGLAQGVGWMWKGTPDDERVLPPVETQAYPTLTRLAQDIEAGRLAAPVGVSQQQIATALAGGPRGSDGARAGDVFNITARDEHSEERIALEVQRRRDFARRTR